MNCPKCGGLMNVETFVSADREAGPWSFEGWRCVYCGEVIDPVILQNRMKSMTPAGEEPAAHAGSSTGKKAA